jgi:hypothetical protein
LLAGCEDVPIAAQALFGLGRTEEAMAHVTTNGTVGCPKAMVLFETAMRINPRDHAAANELGALLARYGQLENAAAVLRHSLQAKPTAEAYYNLSVVYRRLGLPREAEVALAESNKLGPVASRSQGEPRQAVDVKLVDLATFQEQSPAEADLALNTPAQTAKPVSGATSPVSQLQAPPRAGPTTAAPRVEERQPQRANLREGGLFGGILGKRNSNTTTIR